VSNKIFKSRRVEVLRDSVARKIAAGEVIDRPFSVVRELLDNAIDSGAQQISLEIKQGGIESIRVTDDGCGMEKEDLELCYLPHATSKIRSEDDLLTTKTLGFRGEALSSITTCARTEIVSNAGEMGYKLRVDNGKIQTLTPHPCPGGTIIEARELFYSLPARKKFLKRPASESTLCRNTFIEKALPFPDREFRFTVDGKERDLLLPGDLLSRVQDVYRGKLEGSMLELLAHSGPGYTIRAVVGKPGLTRKDRKMVQVFVNKRRIQEYALIQAAVYGYEQVLPGGVFPVCFLFIEIEPHLIDFNIHPAKREAKFRNLNEIHHSVVSMIRDYLSGFSLKSVQNQLPVKQLDLSSRPSNEKKPETSTVPKTNWSENWFKEDVKKEAQAFSYVFQENTLEYSSTEKKPDYPFHFLGQAMNLFLLFEMDSSIYIMDQHAAHERILFEKFKNSPGDRQDLLIPEELEVDDETDKILEKNRERLTQAGFILIRKQPGQWSLEGLPARAVELEDTIIRFLRNPEGNPEDLMVELYATMACRKAIKDGDPIGTSTAYEIISQAIELPVPRCPHGRPLWYEVTREELFQLLGRLL